MIKIKHIVFDVGRVLIQWDPEIPFKHLIPDHKKRDWFLSEVCTGAWNVEQDRGRSWREAEDVLIAQYLPAPELRRTALASSFSASLEMTREGLTELRQEKAFASLMIRQRGGESVN